MNDFINSITNAASTTLNAIIKIISKGVLEVSVSLSDPNKILKIEKKSISEKKMTKTRWIKRLKNRSIYLIIARQI